MNLQKFKASPCMSAPAFNEHKVLKVPYSNVTSQNPKNGELTWREQVRAC
jgi:hypothetical protein